MPDRRNLSMTSTDRQHGSFSFRGLLPSDFEEIKALHEEMFPVKYSDHYYQNICNGIGLHKGMIYSDIAISNESGLIAGFIVAQLMTYPDQCEDELFMTGKQPSSACYILTLGVRREYRRTGLATTIINHCKQFAIDSHNCGAIYLHVIDYNHSAIKFYNQNRFRFIQVLHEFYKINDSFFTAYLYAFYLNNYQPPFMCSFLANARYVSLIDI